MQMKGKIVWSIAYAMAIVSAASAATYGAENASTTWKAGLAGGGLFLCALVAVKCMAWAAAAWRQRSYGWSLFIGVGGLVCFAVTLASSTGMWAGRADKIVAERGAAVDSRKDLRAERDAKRAELALLTKRQAGTIEADLAAAKLSKAWSSSAQCAEVTLQASRQFCDGYRKLEGELAGARRVPILEARLAAITGKLDELPKVNAADAQAEALARLLRVSPDMASSVFAFATSLALELGAMIATLAAEVLGGEQRKPVARQGRRVWRRVAKPALAADIGMPITAPVASLRIPAAKFSPPAVVQFPALGERVSKLGSRFGNVVHFLAAVLAPALGERLDAYELLEEYRAWCAKRSVKAVSAEAFAEQLAEAVKRIEGLQCVREGKSFVLLNAKLVA
jgi:hypothetical protein